MIEDKSRAWVEIDSRALIHNFELAKRLTGKQIMCVIKGDAHGHGAALCGKLLEAHGADAFAVACLSEGIELRRSGITRPILVLGWTTPAYAGLLAEHSLAQSVFDEEYAVELSEAAQAAGLPLEVHIKLDTGMSRTGILAQTNHEEAARTVRRIADLPGLRVTGIFTHCAAADMPEKDDFTAWQVENYSAVLRALERQGFDRPLLRHMGNSAVILNHPEAYFDMVRLGVMMYGLYPDGVDRPDGPLQPVMTLKARVAQVKELPAGAHVSYGCTFRTERPTKIAVIAAGYADAYPRSLSSKGAYAVINRERCPQIGRICMDMCMFDVTGVDVKRGDEVILYGRGGMSLEAVTNLVGTINCEPTSLMTNRVKKILV